MGFDTKYIDLKEANRIKSLGKDLYLKIEPIKYTDGLRNPRLPRKSSKQTNLQIDTNYLFEYAFKEVNTFYSETDRFSIDINVINILSPKIQPQLSRFKLVC